MAGFRLDGAYTPGSPLAYVVGKRPVFEQRTNLGPSLVI